MPDRKKWEHTIINISRNYIRILDNITLHNNSVIIFDIDNTLIDKDGKCIIPISILYYYSKMIGCITVLLTERKECVRKYTISQLKKCGIHDYEYLLMRDNYEEDIKNFKLQSRKKISDLGYKIVMTIGDKNFDICGGYNGISVKIPLY